MTWEEVLEMQRKGQAASQKNRALAAQGAQESAEAASKIPQGDPMLAAIGQIAGQAAGTAIGGPIGGQIGGQLGGSLAGKGDLSGVSPTKLAAGALGNAATGALASGMTSGISEAFGAEAGKNIMQDGQSMFSIEGAGLGGSDVVIPQGQQAALLQQQDADFLNKQFFATGGPVKHYKGGGTVSDAPVSVSVNPEAIQAIQTPANQSPQQFNQTSSLRGALNTTPQVSGVMDAPQQQYNQGPINSGLGNTLPGGK
jgi:hypothetical protein